MSESLVLTAAEIRDGTGFAPDARFLQLPPPDALPPEGLSFTITPDWYR